MHPPRKPFTTGRITRRQPQIGDLSVAGSTLPPHNYLHSCMNTHWRQAQSVQPRIRLRTTEQNSKPPRGLHPRTATGSPRFLARNRREEEERERPEGGGERNGGGAHTRGWRGRRAGTGTQSPPPPLERGALSAAAGEWERAEAELRRTSPSSRA